MQRAAMQRITLMLVLALLLAGCGLLDGAEETSLTETTGKAPAADLVGPSWILSGFEKSTGDLVEPGPSEIFLIFRTNGDLEFFERPHGPQTLGARYEVSGPDSIDVRVGGITEVGSPEGSRFEDALCALGLASAYEVSGTTLRVKYPICEFTDYGLQIDSARIGALRFEAQAIDDMQ